MGAVKTCTRRVQAAPKCPECTGTGGYPIDDEPGYLPTWDRCAVCQGTGIHPQAANITEAQRVLADARTEHDQIKIAIWTGVLQALQKARK